jgi:hypothetical protein
MNVNDFDCHALYDLGASLSIMPRKIYDMLGLPPLENCYFDVPLADVLTDSATICVCLSIAFFLSSFDHGTFEEVATVAYVLMDSIFEF